VLYANIDKKQTQKELFQEKLEKAKSKIRRMKTKAEEQLKRETKI
jgi:hypothetical protein